MMAYVRALVTRTFVDPVTGELLARQFVPIPRMPPVPSGTFVRKREVFQGVLGPEIARTTVNNADEFIRRWAART